MGASLERVLVVKLEHDTFYGALELRTAQGETVRVDSRPSDAIVLATKTTRPSSWRSRCCKSAARHGSRRPAR